MPACQLQLWATRRERAQVVGHIGYCDGGAAEERALEPNGATIVQPVGHQWLDQLREHAVQIGAG